MPDNYFDCFLYENGGPEGLEGYPFEGYHKVLDAVRTGVPAKEGVKILDIGIGGGMLSYPLYCRGADLTGIDFLAKMIESAGKVMPRATLIQHDIKNGLPGELDGSRFDYVISSYALHHIDDSGKIEMLKALGDMVPEPGRIIIADVSFETRAAMEDVQKDAGEHWDVEEFYIVAEDFLPELERQGMTPSYKQISCCGGVLSV